MSTATLERATETETGLDVQIVEVTPLLAQQWLAHNKRNRRLKPLAVAAYARDMAEGRWVLNGEAIKFSGPSWAPAFLEDGQNRLHAVLKSQATVRMMVIFGVPEGSQQTMDAGSKRTVADNLTIAGTRHAHTIAAAATLALRIQDGISSGYGTALTNARVQEFVSENPTLARSAATAVQFAKRSDVPKSIVAYTHWRFSFLDLDEATNFWRDMAEKVGLQAGDPVLALSNRFAQARRNSERIYPAAAVAAIFRTWNARREGQPLKTVQLVAPQGELPRIK